MRKLLVLLLFLPLMATAKIPVEEDIIRQTLDSESPYYYPNLMLRYQSGDDSMTEEVPAILKPASPPLRVT